MNDLDERARAACLTDADPWVRIAALDEASAETALANDPQPWVRRAAFRLLVVVDGRRAGALASVCQDPWLQTRAAALLDPRDPEQLVALLRLACDASPAVCAAAADALSRMADLDDALDALLQSERLRGDEHAAVRIAAHAHRSRRFEEADFTRLETARASETAAVRAWIDDARGIQQVAGEPALHVANETQTAREPAPLRALGATGMRVSALVVSGAGMLPSRAYTDALHAGCNLFFWEPRYHTLGRMLARERGAGVIAGSYEATARAIVSDVDRSLRRLRRDVLDVFLLFWARSAARLDTPLFEVMLGLKQAGKIRAFGFSTHDRDLACDALRDHAWDVIMTRHSAVHPGIEDRLLPLACEKNTGVLGFSALSYGRVVGPTISAPDAYRYSLSQPGVSACLSAPRTLSEIEQNLGVLRAPPLSANRQAELRARGKIVHADSRDFARSIRRHPVGLADANAQDLTKWLDHEDALDPRFG
jgi:aryl-alcohol dehydrogenase-like predicted oxidoreductase